MIIIGSFYVLEVLSPRIIVIAAREQEDSRVREKVINAIAVLSQNIEMVLMIKILFFKDTSRRQGMAAALRSLVVAIIFLVPILLHSNNDNYYDKMVVAIMIANTTATFHQE